MINLEIVTMTGIVNEISKYSQWIFENERLIIMTIIFIELSFHLFNKTSSELITIYRNTPYID